MASGVLVKTFPSSGKTFIHAKVLIADGKLAFVGSQNFSRPSLDLNRELGIFVSKPEILQDLQAVFEKDWEDSRVFYALGDDKSIQGVVKLSSSGVCHPPDSSSYNQTKSFTPYDSLDDCLAAGGRSPANYKK